MRLRSALHVAAATSAAHAQSSQSGSTAEKELHKEGIIPRPPDE